MGWREKEQRILFLLYYMYRASSFNLITNLQYIFIFIICRRYKSSKIVPYLISKYKISRYFNNDMLIFDIKSFKNVGFQIGF